ncbi:hypothetical protein PtA15_16A252 [Puccinia triticina]|uniref:HBS1-like protein N-terminal domain-containing protein n=1 Tax=Puccinia triticina TaxID=208348 RepID=A0ABY7D406_9BASI|nr:uncharacterized protein PtA15_16A252 [Puccinia triticina]WAQ92346.1 hypothetical protein PtA15_16A252 [Puccinia triticina]
MPSSTSYPQLLPLPAAENRQPTPRNPSRDAEHTLSPHQRQLTSESSSCPSDTEISSLYGKYRNSDGSSTEPLEQEDARQDSFTQGDDAHGLLLPGPRRSTVIDELNWMLGQAIDSAQTGFASSQQASPEPHHRLSHVRPYSPLVNGLERLSIDKERTLHTPEGTHPGEHSIEDLSEPISASSLSDYSADPAEDPHTATTSSSLHQQHRRRVYNLVDTSSSVAADERLKEYSAYDLTALSKPQDNPQLGSSKTGLQPPPNKEDYAGSTISARAQSASSEEVLSTSALEDSNTQLLRRSPSQQRNPLLAGINLQDLVAARKQDALREARQSTSSDQLPSSLEDFDPPPRSKAMMTKKRLEEDQYHPLPANSASPNGKQLQARSPVVKRSSSDMSFLEQWQWLESQHPSGSSPPKKKHSIPTAEPIKPARTTATPPTTTRDKSIQALDSHFSSSISSSDRANKLAILSQRQRNLQQAAHQQRPHPNVHNNKAAKTTTTTKLVGGAWFDRVPTIDPKDLKKIKTAADRCRVYESKLEQLCSQPTGLDLWVWLKTCAEGPTTPAVAPQPARKPGYSPLASHHPLPLPPHLQQPGQSGGAPQLRDTSLSSIASFPLRPGTAAQKAVQIRRGSDLQLLEISHPSNTTTVVNSLMEINSLPYPSLYPHSVPIHPAPPPPEVPSNAPKGGPGGRFFAHIVRHNSAKRRNHSASPSASPSKPRISAPLRPPPPPRGPRPDLFVPHNSVGALRPAAAPPARFSHDDNPPPGLPRGPHRMSFAYGSASGPGRPSSPPPAAALPGPAHPPGLLEGLLDKLVAILPDADPALLRALLIANHLDDVLTIGAYLEAANNPA